MSERHRYYADRHETMPTYVAVQRLSDYEYSLILEFQGGGCGICGEPGACYVDHDHETQLVRGVLCPACNARLGRYHDDADRLDAAGWLRHATYLRRPPANLLGIEATYSHIGQRKA